APAVSAGPSQTVGTGGTATITVTFTDPGTSDAPWSYSVDWGDGTLPSGGSTSNQTAGITVTHTYMAPGSDLVRATVTDKDGGAGSGTATVTVSPTPPPPPPPAVTFVGAGNIARCDHTNDEATAAILDTIPGTVFALGDNAFPGGTPSAYQNCYDPTWGRQKSRTYPV